MVTIPHKNTNLYAGMYQFDQGTIVDIQAVETWYPILGMTESDANSFIFQNGGELKCAVSGKYLVNPSISFMDGNKTLYQTAVAINGVPYYGTFLKAFIDKIDDLVFTCTTAPIELNENDVISLVIKNVTNVEKPTIIHASLTLIRIGAI